MKRKMMKRIISKPGISMMLRKLMRYKIMRTSSRIRLLGNPLLVARVKEVIKMIR